MFHTYISEVNENVNQQPNTCFHRNRDVLAHVSVILCSFQCCFSKVFLTNAILIHMTGKHLCESTGARVSTMKQQMPLLLRLHIFDS